MCLRCQKTIPNSGPGAEIGHISVLLDAVVWCGGVVIHMLHCSLKSHMTIYLSGLFCWWWSYVATPTNLFDTTRPLSWMLKISLINLLFFWWGTDRTHGVFNGYDVSIYWMMEPRSGEEQYYVVGFEKRQKSKGNILWQSSKLLIDWAMPDLIVCVCHEFDCLIGYHAKWLRGSAEVRINVQRVPLSIHLLCLAH